MRPEAALESIQNVHVNYGTRKGNVQAVRGVTLDLYAGRESGADWRKRLGQDDAGVGDCAPACQHGQGRSRARSSIAAISVEVDVLKLKDEAIRAFRWRDCAMVFQSALNAFNPVLRIWDQVWDTARAHGWNDRQAVRERFLELLKFVQLGP